MERVMSKLEEELKLNRTFDKMRKMQETAIIAPDIIEIIEDMQAEILVLQRAVASLIRQNIRREKSEDGE